jgi:hypothetical protein
MKTGPRPRTDLQREIAKCENVVEIILRRHPGPGGRAYRYDAVLDGEVIATSRDPEFAACRALQARGIDGIAVFRREGGGTAKLWVPIALGAKLVTREDGREGQPFVAYKPRPEIATEAQKQAETGGGATTLPETRNGPEIAVLSQRAR